MKITLNGKSREIPDAQTVADLLQELQIDPARVVIERNAEILPKQSYDRQQLVENDVLEIVHFVGGG